MFGQAGRKAMESYPIETPTLKIDRIYLEYFNFRSYIGGNQSQKTRSFFSGEVK
jgi:hypothetical protein